MPREGYGVITVAIDIVFRIDTLVAKMNELKAEAKIKGRKYSRASFVKDAVLDALVYHEDRISHAYMLLLQKKTRNDKKRRELSNAEKKA